LNKPIYYLWTSSFQNLDEVEEQKNKFTKWGFRVVVFKEGTLDINAGLRKLVKNHINDKKI